MRIPVAIVFTVVAALFASACDTPAEPEAPAWMPDTLKNVGAAPGAASGMPPAAPGTTPPMDEVHGRTNAAPTNVDLSGITKADGGHLVADVFAQRDALTDKEVTVRGKVVKYNAGIMGKNWLHLRDGSGAEGTNDLTVTTQGSAAVGNLVLVRGKVGRGRDFGFGYTYDVIVEDAQVTVE